MARSKHPVLAKTKREAEARFRELVDEIKLLTVAFPHLSDAADPEDLPIPFLLKQGADMAARPEEAAARRRAPRRRRKS